MSIFVYSTVAMILFLAFKGIFQNWAIYQFSTEHECQDPPRTDAYDIIGILFPLKILQKFRKRGVLAWTKKLFEKYNGTFVSTILLQDYIFTSHHRNIQDILTVQFENFNVAVERVHLFKPLSARGVLTLDGQTWTASRQQLRRQFSQYRSIVNLDMHERHFQNFVARIPSNGSSIDLQEMFLKLALDTLTEFSLGESVDSLSANQSAEKREVSDAIRYTKDTIARKGFAGPFHWMVGRHKFDRSCGIIQQYIQRFAGQASDENEKYVARDANGSKYCLMQSLAAEEKDLVVLRDQVSNVLIAGVDAMTSLLSAALWLLARDERVSRIMKTEILEICGSSSPTYNQLKSLIYLRYVINEALRLFPPITFDMRTASRDTTLPFGGGKDGESKIMVRKGQNVVFSSYSTHRSTNIYGPDGHKFRPERWEGIKANTPGYLPFHMGPRSCPGQQYALRVASYILVRIFQTFSKIESRDADEWKENISMTLGNQNGVIVSLS